VGGEVNDCDHSNPSGLASPGILVPRVPNYTDPKILDDLNRLNLAAMKVAHITERPLGTTPTDLDRFRELFLDAGIFLSEREKDAHTMTVLSITHHVGLRGFACEFFFDSEGAFQVNGVFNDRP
jgi:hypothetical protein